ESALDLVDGCRREFLVLQHRGHPADVLGPQVFGGKAEEGDEENEEQDHEIAQANEPEELVLRAFGGRATHFTAAIFFRYPCSLRSAKYWAGLRFSSSSRK